MIYIAITTVPDRLMSTDIILESLSSLLNQKTSETYKVVISIPYKYKCYEEEVIIPKHLTDMENKYNGQLIILRSDIDYGPITNLLCPLKLLDMNSEDIIIICDDDHIYSPDMLDYHIYKLKQYPNNRAICFRGSQAMELRAWKQGDIQMGKFYDTHVYFPTNRDVYLKFPDHWHSVSYRRGLLGSDIFDKDFLDITWNNDHLMAYYAATHNFYFLCAVYDQETDHRVVNDVGRGSSSFPIDSTIYVDHSGGCNVLRARFPELKNNVWDNIKFKSVFISKEEIKLQWDK